MNESADHRPLEVVSNNYDKLIHINSGATDDKYHNSASTATTIMPSNVNNINSNHPPPHFITNHHSPNPDMSTMENDTLSTISNDIQSVKQSKKRVKRSKSLLLIEPYRVMSNSSPSGSALVSQFFTTQREQMKLYSNSTNKTKSLPSPPTPNIDSSTPTTIRVVNDKNSNSNNSSPLRLRSSQPPTPPPPPPPEAVGSVKRNSAQELIYTRPRANSKPISKSSLNTSPSGSKFYSTPRNPCIPKSPCRSLQGQHSSGSKSRALMQYQYSLKSQPMGDVYVASLLSQQDEMYGTNMLENITLEDILFIQFQMSEGVLEIEALLNVFEKKINNSSCSSSNSSAHGVGNIAPTTEHVGDKNKSRPSSRPSSRPNSLSRDKSYNSSTKKEYNGATTSKDQKIIKAQCGNTEQQELAQAIELSLKEMARGKAESHSGGSSRIIAKSDKIDQDGAASRKATPSTADTIQYGTIAALPGGSITASKKTQSRIVYASPVSITSSLGGSDSDDSFQYVEKVQYTTCTPSSLYCTTEMDTIKIAQCLSADTAFYDRMESGDCVGIGVGIGGDCVDGQNGDYVSAEVQQLSKHLQYDFCLVFACENNNDFTAGGKACLDILRHELNMGISAYKGRGLRQHIFALVKVPIEVYKKFAELINYRLLLDKVIVREYLERGNREKGINGAVIPHDLTLTTYQPWELIYGRYSSQVDDCLYWREEGQEHSFSEVVRMKLALSLIQSKAGCKKGCINIHTLMKDGTLLGCFPFHNEDMKLELFSKLSWFPVVASLPVEELRGYVGEKATLIYCFIEHCMYRSIVPGIIGLVIEIYILSSQNFNSVVLPFYGLFSTIWIMFQLLQSWRSREQVLALQWGTLNGDRRQVGKEEEGEEDRLEFRGDAVQSYIDGSMMLHYPKRKQDKLIYGSMYRMTALSVVVVGLIACICVIRAHLQVVVGGSASHIVAALLNSLQVVCLNYWIRRVSDVLTFRENHRTDTLHEDSVIKKMFILQSINSYAYLLYIAFIAKYVEENPTSDGSDGSGSGGCMSVLALNILVVFLTSIAMNAVVEVASYRWSLYHRKVEYYDIFSDNTPSAPEKEYLLLPYSRSTDLIVHQYARLSVLFGYMALFATALPASAALFMVALLVELHVDMRRMLLCFQRPFPTAVQDIGTWSSVLWIISIASIVTNAAIMSFTMDIFDHFNDSVRYWMFILFQWIGLIVVLRLNRGDYDHQRCSSSRSSHIDDNDSMPTAVSIQLARTAFIVRQLIDQVRGDVEWTSKNTAALLSSTEKDNDDDVNDDVTIHDSYDELLLP